MIDESFYMHLALKQAVEALAHDDVPVGAVIVFENKIIAKACNQVQLLSDPTAHAEIIAITQGVSAIESKWLHKATMYVTIEPCTMCAGALILSRIDKIVFGSYDSKTGAFGSKLDINKLGLNHKIEVESGVLKEECGELVTKFFKRKRKNK